MAKQLKKKGAVIIEPEGDFRVTGIKGPLKDGELERAAQWAKDVVIAAKA